jgi:hypothetical protein
MLFLWNLVIEMLTFGFLGVGKTMDLNMENMKEELDEKWQQLGLSPGNVTAEKAMEIINREDFKAGRGKSQPLRGADKHYLGNIRGARDIGI